MSENPKQSMIFNNADKYGTKNSTLIESTLKKNSMNVQKYTI